RELEGAGADRAQRIVHSELLHRGRTDDRGGPRRQDGQKRRTRLLEAELHRERVDDLDGLDIAEEVIRERILAELVEGMLGHDLPFDGELHGVGVERRPVVKRDALAELERVLEPVLADRPRLREAGHDLRALVGEGHERLDDAAAHAVGVEIGYLRGIEIHGLGHEADDECAGRLRGDECTGREEHDREHRVFLICRSDHPIIAYDDKGEFLRSWGEGEFTYRTHGIATAPDGTVWATDDGNHTVRQFTPQGKLLNTLGTLDTPSDTGY